MTKSARRRAVAAVLLVALGLAARAYPARPVAPRDPPHPEAPIRLPEWWRAGDPLPKLKSNCVRCHLTAGRELTAAVRDFARSAHDLREMSCADCHGGNTSVDELAHDEQFQFIGTKRSAHIQNCIDCHTEEAEQLRRGPHYWDFAKRINTQYPTCVDCHGNHDVGNPPDEFRLLNVCKDCHKKFEAEQPVYAEFVRANDALWASLRQVSQRQAVNGPRFPREFRDEIAALRYQTMRIAHGVAKMPADRAGAANARARRLKIRLDVWLKNAAP
jgi:nitrate/TMAO reductase-like tetraheme cytochrome c subunit